MVTVDSCQTSVFSPLILVFINTASYVRGFQLFTPSQVVKISCGLRASKSDPTSLEERLAQRIKLEQSFEQSSASGRPISTMNDRGLPGQNFSEADNDAVIQSDPIVCTEAITSVTRIEDSVENFDKHRDVEGRNETVQEMLKGDGKGEASLANRISAAATGMFASGFAMEKASAGEPVQAQGQVQQVTRSAETVAPPSGEHREPKEKKSFFRMLGIGKDVSKGKDPHPELAENKGGFMSRVAGAFKSKTDGAEAMERPVLSSQPTGAATTEAPEGCLGRLYGAISSRMGPGNAAVKPPPPTLPDDVESMSNVQKVSPYSGPTDEKATGTSDFIPAEDTSAVAASDVKAPGVAMRAKEEVVAVGEAVKELVVGKKE